MSTRILFLGDSIAAETARSFVPMTVRLVAESVAVSTNSVNSSVPSSNVLDLLDRTQELLPLQTAAFSVACIFVGVNDSKILVRFDEALVPLGLFERRLQMLVERLEESGSKVVLCGLPDLNLEAVERGGALKEYWYWTPSEYRKYDSAIRRISEDRAERRFVDLDAAFKASGRSPDELFSPDGVHPSVVGQALIADAAAAGILSALT